MAASNFADRIEELEEERRKNRRQARRARSRRREYLRQRKWPEAREALRVARQNNRYAQENLRDIRTLRRDRKQANRLARIARHRRRVVGKQGLVWVNGKQVPVWIAEELSRARKAGWRGYVVSGYRTPAYSEQLCLAMCGARSCSGTCAGRSSNHSQGYVFPQGAVDVTDYINLANIAGRLGLRIKNRLPRDRVHFSSSGV